MSEAKDLVLCYTVCLQDGWYGDRHRFILSIDSDIGFTTKAAAKKYTAKLKNYITHRFPDYVLKKLTNADIDVSERAELIEYTHVSAGPSLSYTHHNFTTTDMDRILQTLED